MSANKQNVIKKILHFVKLFLLAITLHSRTSDISHQKKKIINQVQQKLFEKLIMPMTRKYCKMEEVKRVNL